MFHAADQYGINNQWGILPSFLFQICVPRFCDSFDPVLSAIYEDYFDAQTEMQLAACSLQLAAPEMKSRVWLHRSLDSSFFLLLPGCACDIVLAKLSVGRRPPRPPRCS